MNPNGDFSLKIEAKHNHDQRAFVLVALLAEWISIDSHVSADSAQGSAMRAGQLWNSRLYQLETREAHGSAR